MFNMKSLGADPELFFIDKNTGKFISAIGLVPGNKFEPAPTPLGDGFMIQHDNVACEFNIPACKTAKEFVEANQAMLDYIYQDFAKPNGLEISSAASALFDFDQLEHPLASVFGCDPDIDAWTGVENSKPKARQKNLRSAGGHIHLGYDNPDAVNSFVAIQWLDFVVSLPLMLHDTDTKRRKLYGKSGACRIKNYGVEYRTPSNWWIFNPEIAQKIAARCLFLDEVISVHRKLQVPHQVLELARLAINMNNKNLAKQLVKEYDLFFLN